MATKAPKHGEGMLAREVKIRGTPVVVEIDEDGYSTRQPGYKTRTRYAWGAPTSVAPDDIDNPMELEVLVDGKPAVIGITRHGVSIRQPGQRRENALYTTWGIVQLRAANAPLPGAGRVTRGFLSR